MLHVALVVAEDIDDLQVPVARRVVHRGVPSLILDLDVDLCV